MTVWRHIGSIGAMLKPGAGGWSLQIQGKAMSGKFFCWTDWGSASDYTLTDCATVTSGRTSPAEVLQVLCANFAFITRRS